MRLFSWAPANEEGIKWLMIYEDVDAGTYLFGSYLATDGGDWDEWYETIAGAQEAALAKYGVLPDVWQQISNPMQHCQHDWIQPVRVKGRNLGQPQWGILEKLINGQWVEFDPTQEKPL